MMRIVFAALLFSIAALAAEPSSGPVTDPPVVLAPTPDLQNPAFTYRICLDLTRNQPDKAIELAGKWLTLSGGEPARHCQALALVALKEWGEGATRLEEIASESRQTPGVRANMLAQAGQAWMLAGELSRAYAAQTTALKIIPQGTRQQAEILLDRAGTLVEGGEVDDAIADINAAMAVIPNNVEAMAFRASAHRLKGEIDLALEDAEAALGMNSQNAAALLERGNIFRIQRRVEDARRDWLKILDLAPETAEADAARENIARVDVDLGKAVK